MPCVPNFYLKLRDQNYSRGGHDCTHTTHVRVQAYYSLRPKHKQAQISSLVVSKIYIEVHIRLRVTTVYRKMIYGAFGVEERALICFE